MITTRKFKLRRSANKSLIALELSVLNLADVWEFWDDSRRKYTLGVKRLGVDFQIACLADISTWDAGEYSQTQNILDSLFSPHPHLLIHVSLCTGYQSRSHPKRLLSFQSFSVANSSCWFYILNCSCICPLLTSSFYHLSPGSQPSFSNWPPCLQSGLPPIHPALWDHCIFSK